jgi:iron complex transport system ATP-binding protein
MSAKAGYMELNGLTFSYGNKPVLKNISVCVSAGETWAVIGRNGAGKSTLVRCMAGLISVERGMVRLNGNDLIDCGPRDRAKVISYVPQANSRSLPSFTVFDYVMLGRFPYQGILAVPGQDDRKIVSEALELTDTAHLSGRVMTTLSGGELQRVFLAGAVAQHTTIMLLDEPSTFLDPLHQELIDNTLARIRNEFGTVVITVTHDINNAVLRYSNVLALVEGSLFFAGSVSEFLCGTPGILSDIFSIPFEEALCGESKRKMFVAKEIQ